MDALGCGILYDVVRHAQAGRGDIAQLDVVEGEEAGQGVDCAAVLQVTDLQHRHFVNGRHTMNNKYGGISSGKVVSKFHHAF